jgi:hypothetical protein
MPPQAAEPPEIIKARRKGTAFPLIGRHSRKNGGEASEAKIHLPSHRQRPQILLAPLSATKFDARNKLSKVPRVGPPAVELVPGHLTAVDVMIVSHR